MPATARSESLQPFLVDGSEKCITKEEIMLINPVHGAFVVDNAIRLQYVQWGEDGVLPNRLYFLPF